MLFFCLPIYIGSYTTYLEGGAEGTHVIFPVLMISCVHFRLSEKTDELGIQRYRAVNGLRKGMEPLLQAALTTWTLLTPTWRTEK
jgi:hypothetical protein